MKLPNNVILNGAKNTYVKKASEKWLNYLFLNSKVLIKQKNKKIDKNNIEIKYQKGYHRYQFEKLCFQ